MGMIDRFKAYLGKWSQSRGGPNWKARIGELIFSHLMGGGSAYGYPGGWSQDRFEQVMHYKHWVYVAVRARCQEHARHRPRVGYIRPGAVSRGGPKTPVTNKQMLSRYLQKASMNRIQPHEEVELADPEHPLVRLLDRPNNLDTAGDLWYELNLYCDLTGNGYIWTPPSIYGKMTGTGQPAEMWVMPSHWVWPKVGVGKLVERYDIRPWVGAGMVSIPAEEVIHFRAKSPIHKLDGYSAQSAGAEWIDTEESVNRSRFYSFKNGCFPLGSVELGEEFGDPTDEELERLYAKFFARLQGEHNTGRPIILPPGAKYNALTINPTEMAYVQSAEQLRDWVLSLFQVPKEIVGIAPSGSDLSWYAPLQMFCRFGIAPSMRGRGETLTHGLCPRYSDPGLAMWWDDPVPDNPNQVNQDLGLDMSHGIRTYNEARAMRGLPPVKVPEADMLMVSQGLVPLGVDEHLGEDGHEPVPEEVSDNQAAPVHGQDTAAAAGTLQAISGLQSQYYEGKLPRSAVIADVQLLFGFSREEAEQLFPEDKPEPLVQQPGGMPGMPGAGGGMPEAPPGPATPGEGGEEEAPGAGGAEENGENASNRLGELLAGKNGNGRFRKANVNRRRK